MLIVQTVRTVRSMQEMQRMQRVQKLLRQQSPTLAWSSCDKNQFKIIINFADLSCD
jgi:hypothetical protein